MKTRTIIMGCACFFLMASEVQAQSKLENFFKKVDKILDDTNEALEGVNNTLEGKETTTAENGETRTVSPTRDLKLEFVQCYDEGHDIVIQLKMTNTTDKELGLNWGRGKAYDDQGNLYEFDDRYFSVGGRSVSPTGVSVPPEIPVKALIHLKNVSDEATSIKTLTIDTHQYQGFEVKDIPITRGQELVQSNTDAAEQGEQASVSLLSPTRKLKLEYKESYLEGGNNLVIEFTMTNTTEEEIGLNSGRGRAWDDEGNLYEFGENEVTLSGRDISSLGVGVPPEIPVKCTITLKGVSKKAKTIKLLKLDTYQFQGFEIKEVSIPWEGNE